MPYACCIVLQLPWKRGVVDRCCILRVTFGLLRTGAPSNQNHVCFVCLSLESVSLLWLGICDVCNLPFVGHGCPSLILSHMHSLHRINAPNVFRASALIIVYCNCPHIILFSFNLILTFTLSCPHSHIHTVHLSHSRTNSHGGLGFAFANFETLEASMWGSRHPPSSILYTQPSGTMCHVLFG